MALVKSDAVQKELYDAVSQINTILSKMNKRITALEEARPKAPAKRAKQDG